MDLNIKYDKILSDLCPGLVIFASLIYKGYIGAPNDTLSGVITAGLLLILSAFIGKLVNLVGYIVLGIAIDHFTFIMFKYFNIITFWYGKIEIRTKREYRKLAHLRMMIEIYSRTLHEYDFSTEEGLRKLVRTLTILAPVLLFMLNGCNWQTISISLGVFFLLLYASCFLKWYLYGKYFEHSLIIIGINSLNVERKYSIDEIIKELNKILREKRI